MTTTRRGGILSKFWRRRRSTRVHPNSAQFIPSYVPFYARIAPFRTLRYAGRSHRAIAESGLRVTWRTCAVTGRFADIPIRGQSIRGLDNLCRTAIFKDYIYIHLQRLSRPNPNIPSNSDLWVNINYSQTDQSAKSLNSNWCVVEWKRETFGALHCSWCYRTK